MRRDRRRGGRAHGRWARQNPVQYRAVADQRTCAVRRRRAGDRRARPCRGARPHHRQGDDGGRQDLGRDRRDRRRRGPGPDRRRDRRPHHRQGDRAGQRQAADGDQPPRGPCAHRAADGGHTVSLLPVPGLRRPHPDPGGARGRRLRAARHHAGRRHRRGLRQDREAVGARLSGRPAGREGSGARQCHAVHAAAADAGPRRAGFFAVGTEDRAAPGGRS